MHKSQGLCLHVEPNQGTCSLSWRRCPGWRRCPQYQGVREKGMVKASIIIKALPGKPGESKQLPSFVSPRAAPRSEIPRECL